MTDQTTTSYALTLYQTEDGRTRFDCRVDADVSGTHAERTALEAE